MATIVKFHLLSDQRLFCFGDHNNDLHSRPLCASGQTVSDVPIGSVWQLYYVVPHESIVEFMREPGGGSWMVRTIRIDNPTYYTTWYHLPT